MAARSCHSSDRCVLCYEELTKHTDRNFIHGKSNAILEIRDLPFDVILCSQYICKSCLVTLKKRKELKAKLSKIEDQLRHSNAETKLKLETRIVNEIHSPEDIARSEVSGSTVQSSEREYNQGSIVSSTPIRSSSKVTGISVSEEELLSSNKKRKLPSECPVSVEVVWTNEKRKKYLHHDLSSLGKMLCRGTFKQIAAAAWKSTPLKQHFYKEIAKQIHKECVVLCQKGSGKENKKRNDSCLRRTDKKSMLEFSFNNLTDELGQKAPLFLLTLKAAALKVNGIDENWIPSVGVAAAVCLKNRSRNMTVVQLLIAMITRHSGFLMCMRRMQMLNLMPSHTYFYKKLTQFGNNHDIQLLERVKNEGLRRTAVVLKSSQSTETSHPSTNVPEKTEIPTRGVTEKDSKEVKENKVKEVRKRIIYSFDQLKAGNDEVEKVDKISVFGKEPVKQQSPDLKPPEAIKAPDETSSILQYATIAPDPGRKLTLDNIDIHQHTHEMTEVHQNPDAHYCSLISTENRVSASHLPHDRPISALEELENGTLCPSKFEHRLQRDNYIQLVARVISENLPCLSPIKDAVMQHIPHRYSKEMQMKTDSTLLGVIYENENKADGMQNILDHLQQYVPKFERDGEIEFAGQGIVGDQLTVERGTNGLFEVLNGFTAAERHDGIHFEIADFHGGMKFLELVYSHFYHTTSSMDKCTLYSDRNLINRRNVSTDVGNNVSACKKFFQIAVDGRIIAAAMKELRLEDFDDIPEEDIFPDSVKNASNVVKTKFVNDLSAKIVDKHILQEDKVSAVLKKLQMAKKEQITTVIDGRFNCRFQGCTKTFRFDGKRRQDHEKSHGLVLQDTTRSGSREGSATESRRDDMLHYQLSLLEIGLLLKNFFDAIKEGDGQRVIRCWKFFLPYLKEDGASSRKYALEGLYLLCQVNSLLSPSASHSLVWNRFYRSKPGAAKNIPLDLALEHFNKLIKTVIRNLGPNGLNRNAIDRYCKALGTNKQLLDNFDSNCSVRRRSGLHVCRSTAEDLKKIVMELVRQRAFYFEDGRSYQHFAGVKESLLSAFDPVSMFKWINEHKKKILLKKCAR